MRSIAEGVLRAVTYVFHLGLGLFLLLLAAVALLGPEATFTVGILPWEGRVLAWILLAAGAVALLTVCLAAQRGVTLPLLLWSLLVLLVLIHGCFLSRYSFGREGPGWAIQLLLAAAVATAGSWRQYRATRRRRPMLGRFEEAPG